ncbi:hypothetical protein A4X13_0g3845 [Tilletia indica]|uniref:Uncharacterized protein n=1 Tax=Tilletia indica TaxID=43049 RepID=A0A8T8T0B6_9BASI|nr:hypothetical protein A4X13_0g3845 [Tilletia indica]
MSDNGMGDDGAASYDVLKLKDELLASTTHPQVRDILSDDQLAGTRLGEAMIRVIDVQLRLHAEQDVKYREMIDERDEDIVLPVTRPGSGDGDDNVLPAGSDGQQPPTLFAHAAARVAIELGKASEEEARSIAKRVPLVASPAFKTALFKFVRLPYAVLSQALRFASTVVTTGDAGGGGANREAETIDEWIIRNEKYMRARLVLDQAREDEPMASSVDDDPSPSLSQLGIDKSASHWKQFMVGLGRDAQSVFMGTGDAKGASNSTIRIQRPDKADLPGLLLLDHHRKDAIEINTLPAFQARFDSMTLGALKGLDWSNVLVAGGIALGALTGTTDEEAQKSEGSDIDLYLYGLTVDQANAKLQEIEKVFLANLPVDKDTGKQIKHAILRNSQTITFVPERYPFRRVQVVLKLCPNPMAILLNFDLDQVAIGYSGDEVWMLPRASRALVTGFTTFTMDLIHGSFLAPRKASQDRRIFKYGKRGYGLRFLPSYIATLRTVSLDERTTTERDVPEESLPRDELHVTLREERARVSWWLAQRNHFFKMPFEKRLLQMVTVDCRTANSGEIAERSSLSCWQLFARHVALWELAQVGYFVLSDEIESWVEDAYSDDPLSYQDGPEFRWDESFTLETLQNAVKWANERDEERLEDSFRGLDIIPSPWRNYRMPRDEREALVKTNTEKYINERMPLKRSILASSLREAFAEPLVAMTHLPKNLRAYVEAELKQSLTRFADVTKGDAPSHAFIPNWATPEQAVTIRSDSEAVLSYWIHGPNEKTSQTTESEATMVEKTGGTIAPHWQLVSRKTDEVFEILHAFRRAHKDLNVEANLRNRSTRRQVSRRLVRPTERSERDAFMRWVYTRTPDFTGWYGDTEDWTMLKVPRWVVFHRFELTKQAAREWKGEPYDFTDWLEDDETDRKPLLPAPKTVEEWMAMSFGSSRYDWNVWHRQRIPPVELLPAIVQGTAALVATPTAD